MFHRKDKKFIFCCFFGMFNQNLRIVKHNETRMIKAQTANWIIRGGLLWRLPHFPSLCFSNAFCPVSTISVEAERSLSLNAHASDRPPNHVSGDVYLYYTRAISKKRFRLLTRPEVVKKRIFWSAPQLVGQKTVLKWLIAHPWQNRGRVYYPLLKELFLNHANL